MTNEKIVNVSGTYHKVMSNNTIIAVISCTPQGRWYRVAVRALKSGGHADYIIDPSQRVYGKRSDLLAA